MTIKILILKKLKKFSKYWELWESWLKRHKLSALQACILFVVNQNKLDGIIVGCDSKENLTEILKSKNMRKKKFLGLKLKINDKKLIDPRNWT